MDYNSTRVEGLKDSEIGKRIKVFSKKFFYIASTFLFLTAISIFIMLTIYASEELIDVGGFIFGLFILGLNTYLGYIGLYFIYIKSIGFGIIVNDINEIKKQLNVNPSNSERLYCTECGRKVSDDDLECPHCGASFED